jgi:GDP-L-fucose synthase
LNLSDRRVCVTGSGGFLGSYLVDGLRARGCNNLALPRKADYNLIDGRAIERLFEAVEPQVVFHLAATVGGIGANRDNPGLFFYENAMMGIQLIECARKYAVEKIVLVGTVCAYPKFATVPFREDEIWDGYPEETNAPYGIAKKAMLVQAQAYREQYGLNGIYLLPVNLYGPRDNFDMKSSHVIPALIRKTLEARESGAREIVCWGDGSATREFLYAGDAAEGMILAAEHFDGAAPVNLGSGFEISIRELAETVAEFCYFDGEIVWDTTKPNGQPRRKLDTTRARSEFGFEAKTSLRDGLKKTIQWYESIHFGDRLKSS